MYDGESSSQSWKEHFGSWTRSRFLMIYSLNIFLIFLRRFVCPKLDLLSYEISHTPASTFGQIEMSFFCKEVSVTIYTYIYILHGTVCDPGFHAISNRRTEWRPLKKEPLIWLIFVLSFIQPKHKNTNIQ